MLMSSLGVVSSFAAEDRFLSATSWQGTLTRSASDAGSGQYVDGSGFLCDQRWNLTHSSSLDITIPLDGSGQSGPSRIYFTYANATAFPTLEESKSEVCTFGTIT